MKKFNVVLLLLLLIFLKNYSEAFEKNQYEYIPYHKLSEKEKQFLDTVQYYAFKYFLQEINPENSLVKDRSTADSPITIAACGFALPIWAIGTEKGWITRQESAEKTLRMLRFFYYSEQSTDPLATGYKGFYYHFLNFHTGKREWKCELSSIDSGLLFAGIIFARNYFNQDNKIEKEIRELARKILKRINWKFFQMSPDSKYPYAINMGWHPEDNQYNSLGWIGYNEALFLYVIAAGLGMKDVEKGYQTWMKHYNWREPYPGFGHLAFPPMFGHQYSHIFIDFRNFADDTLRYRGIDFFENSRRATYVQRFYAIDNPKGWKGYDSLTWGITACDGPGEKYNSNGLKFYDYAGRGTSGPDLVFFDDGTLAPTAAGGSIPFAPEICIPTLMSMYERFKDKGIWKKYGFVDAFNLTVNWFDDDFLGIDQGPIVLMIENYRNGFVWNYFMKDEIVQKGLKKLNIRKLK
ncbi:MAG: glucoamylase family protein [Ignavibacteria bacterium]